MAVAEGKELAHGIVTRGRAEIASSQPRGYIERRASFEGMVDDYVFGVSPGWREHYQVDEGQFDYHPTTNDAFAMSIVSCLLAVFAGALDARGIAISKGQLTTEAEWEVGPVSGPSSVWIVRRINVTHRLRLSDPKEQATAVRVLKFYDTGCPLSQTLAGSRCELTSELVFV
jgi:uncharacterized OsmC-like protein